MTRHHREGRDGPRKRKTYPVDEPIGDESAVQPSSAVSGSVYRQLPPPSRRRRQFGDKDDEEEIKDESMASVWCCATFGLILVILGMTSVYGMKIYMEYLERIKVNNPLIASRVIHHNDTHPFVVDPDRFWGSYRPHVYFGMRTRSPNSMITGLMWFDQHSLYKGGPLPLRHWCEHGDGLRRYGWNAHDGRTFGSQEIEDHRFTITTQFLKRPTKGYHGGDWTARITATPHNTKQPVIVSLMFYAMLPEGSDGNDYREGYPNGAELRGVIGSGERLDEIVGNTRETGPFSVSFVSSPRTADNVLKYNYLSAFVPSAEAGVMNNAILQNLGVRRMNQQNSFQFLALRGKQQNERNMPDNLVVHQVTVTLPFTLEVVYMSEDSPLPPSVPPLRDDMFQEWMQYSLNEFDQKFEEKFGLKTKGLSEREIKVAQSAFSNCLGSVGYFYGASIVQSPLTEVPVNYWNSPLYTGVPSRSFFPRGFLWDEGFHNLLISEWDINISKDILGHWFDLINREGWIPREQILGPEARSKVPSEFVVQHNDNANPPAFFLPLMKIVPKLVQSGHPEDIEWLETMYPRLQAWYAWYNKTQRGDESNAGAFRWRGRNALTNRELNPKTLTSGLDDYPRASHPTQKERHVDLRCWMHLAAVVMSSIASALEDKAKDVRKYQADAKLLGDNGLLDHLHWSSELESFADFGLHSDNVVLKRPPPPANRKPGQPVVNSEKVRVIKGDPKYQFVNAQGYVSLFPFLLRVLNPDSQRLGQILSDLTNSSRLWTPYGLRSLARNSKLYNKHNTEHDAPYWRGSIWINCNYLAIAALDHYRTVKGPHAKLAGEIYAKLRQNVIDNIVSEYYRTGYIWEHYNDITGYGEGTHPFTGWSALVVLIMGEKYH